MARQLGSCCMTVLDASQNQLVSTGRGMETAAIWQQQGCNASKRAALLWLVQAAAMCACTHRLLNYCLQQDCYVSWVPVGWQAWWASQHVCMLCWLQGDCFLSALSRSALLREADVLTVLDMSENAIGDSGTAALAATLAAAGGPALRMQQCTTTACSSQPIALHTFRP